MARDSGAADFGVGMEVEIHSLSSTAGSRYNGCKGTVKHVNSDGRRVVRLSDSDSLPVVKPVNLRALSCSSQGPSASNTSASDIFEVVGLQSEQGRLLNGLLGRLLDTQCTDERLVVEILATGQRKSLKRANVANLALEEIVLRLHACLENGQLYDVCRLMQGLPNLPKTLNMALKSKLAAGTHSELMGKSLDLVDVPGRGKGYRAARKITAGEAILFETSFCSAREGPGEYDIMVGQCEAKAAESVDLANFLASRVMALEIGNPMARMMDKSRLISILKNNVFKTTRDPDYIALFVAASRFNHSCCANAFADHSKDQMIVRALRGIDRGEEVCISYVPVSEPRDERQSHLLGKGFVCRCERCEREEREDPQFAVRCGCDQHNFSAQANAPQRQSCPHCGAKFAKAEALMNLDEFRKMNDFMRTPAAAAANPLDLIQKLEPVAATLDGNCLGSKAPRAHPHSVQLLNCLSGAHYFAATRVPGPHRDASSKAALLHKRKVLSAMAANHGDGTPQRDVNYFMAMHRMLMGEFPTAKEKVLCEKELEELCLLHFGQVSLPAGITSSVCR